jgi:hypothetical protein
VKVERFTDPSGQGNVETIGVFKLDVTLDTYTMPIPTGACTSKVLETQDVYTVRFDDRLWVVHRPKYHGKAEPCPYFRLSLPLDASVAELGCPHCGRQMED